jgi:hypothetical protein
LLLLLLESTNTPMHGQTDDDDGGFNHNTFASRAGRGFRRGVVEVR